MYEIITTNGTFWSNHPTPSNDPTILSDWQVAKTFVNGWVMRSAYDSLRPEAQDDLDQVNTTIVVINPDQLVAVVDLAGSAEPQ